MKRQRPTIHARSFNVCFIGNLCVWPQARSARPNAKNLFTKTKTQTQTQTETQTQTKTKTQTQTQTKTQTQTYTFVSVL